MKKFLLNSTWIWKLNFNTHRPTKCLSFLPTQRPRIVCPTTSLKNNDKIKKTKLRNSNENISKHSLSKNRSIIAVGLTIHDAPVELREELAVAEADWPKVIEQLCRKPYIEEAAILSTCNRMELYVVVATWHRGVEGVLEWLSETSRLKLEDLRPYLFLLRDQDAVMHLLRVSGGLDSLVMGEGQILAQVKRVQRVGETCPGFGRHLNGLFKQAIIAGKRVRTETNISTGGVSISSAAVELMQLKLPSQNLSEVRISIIGAGKMSNLLIKHLISKGSEKVTVVNRSVARAESLRNEFDSCEFDIRPLSDLNQVVSDSDVIFAASGSEELLLLKEDVSTMPNRPSTVGGLRRFIDIAVPRNIDPKINDLQGLCIVYNVDDLKEVVAVNKEARNKAAADALVLLREELEAFDAWRDSLETVPVIKALRSKAETIRSTEFEKTLLKIGDGLSKKQRKAIEELSKSVVNKLLHGPMTSLRCSGTDSDAVGQTLLNMEALERMFSLKESLIKDDDSFKTGYV